MTREEAARWLVEFFCPPSMGGLGNTRRDMTEAFLALTAPSGVALAPDANCVTLPDGSCVGKDCMHDGPGPSTVIHGERCFRCGLTLKEDPHDFGFRDHAWRDKCTECFAEVSEGEHHECSSVSTCGRCGSEAHQVPDCTAKVPDKLTVEGALDFEWVVNDIAELGARVGDQFFWLYKRSSPLIYDGTHDDGRPMRWRPIYHREFGECVMPIALTRLPDDYSKNDPEAWKDLPQRNLRIVEAKQPGRWWCERCQSGVVPDHVTFEEYHDPRFGGCGARVEWQQRVVEACPCGHRHDEHYGESTPPGRHACMGDAPGDTTGTVYCACDACACPACKGTGRKM